MVERKVGGDTAILARKLVAQEQVEPGKGRIFGWFHILLQGYDGWDLHGPAGAVNFPFIAGDDVHPIQKNRLDGGLPGPQAQRVVTQRRIVGVKNERRATIWMTYKVGMVHKPVLLPLVRPAHP